MRCLSIVGYNIYLSSFLKVYFYYSRWRNGDCGSRAKFGFDAFDEHRNTSYVGLESYETSTAGIAGGLVSGIAKDANLYSVKVIGHAQHGTSETIIAGLDYIGNEHRENSKR